MHPQRTPRNALGTKKAHPREDGPAVFSATWKWRALRLPSTRTQDRDPSGRDRDVRDDAAASNSASRNASAQRESGQGSLLLVTGSTINGVIAGTLGVAEGL